MNITDLEKYEGVKVDLEFTGEQPGFGDLFTICGFENPNFPSSGKFRFHECEDLQFSQVDDYFGVVTLSEEGDDVAVWLYPLIDIVPVHHHPGPFTGLRIEYNVLRHPIRRSEHFYLVLETLMNKIPVTSKVKIEEIKLKVDAISEYWKSQGIEVGSKEALDVDY